jgi:hypothetical protein
MGTAKCGIQTTNPSSSPSPLESEWCSRSDSRIQTGWISQNYIGFLWDADALTRTERNAVFPWPYINAATFDIKNNMKYVGRPYIWSPNNAWLFASSAVNENGEIGILAYYGGLDNPPSLAFGVVNDPTKSASLGMLSIANSTHFPTAVPNDSDDFEYIWGDYIRLRPDDGIPNGWDAAGFVLEGGNDKTNIQPYYFTIQNQELGTAVGTEDSNLLPFPPGPLQPTFPE